MVRLELIADSARSVHAHHAPSRTALTLTTEQRSEINRKNGQKSQKYEDRRRRQGQVAAETPTKHGLRAGRSARDADRRRNGHRGANSGRGMSITSQRRVPRRGNLVNECVRATIMSDRCHTYHDAAAGQARRRVAAFRQICQDDVEVERLVAAFAAEPANTVAAACGGSGAGCRYLIGTLKQEHLEGILKTRRLLDCSGSATKSAIRLQGAPAEDETIKSHEVAWLTRLYCLVGWNDTPLEQTIDWMMDRKRLPQSLWSSYGMEVYPTLTEARAHLKTLVAEKLTSLRGWLEQLTQAFEKANDANVADRALILQDEPSAKLFLRYLAESRSTFHRSFKELLKTLDRDQAENATPLVVSPNEPKVVVDEAKAKSEAVSPNEPNAEESEEAAQSRKSEAVVSTPTAVSPNEPNSSSVVEADSAEVSASPSQQQAA